MPNDKNAKTDTTDVNDQGQFVAAGQTQKLPVTPQEIAREGTAVSADVIEPGPGEETLTRLWSFDTDATVRFRSDPDAFKPDAVVATRSPS